MRKILIGLAVLVVVLIAAIAIVPQLVPSSVYKDKIQTTLTKELGREVRIDGDVKLAVFPSIKARTGRVEIANPEGFSSDTFAAMDGLDAKVKLLPLLSKRVEIKAFTLKNPAINLEKNAQGEPNWLLGAEKPEQVIDEEPEGPFKRDGRYASVDPAIGLFSIENGAITYLDKTKGTDYRLTDVNLAFALPSMDKPVDIDGSLNFNNDPIDLDLRLDTPRAFLDGRETPLTLKFNAPYANIDAKGKFLESADIAFDLNIDGDVSDVSALVERLPMEVPYSDLAQTVTLKGNYLYDGQTFSAKGAEITANGALFDANYTGGGALTQPPSLNGNVEASVNDIPKLAKILGQDIKGLELIRTANLTAALTSQGKGFAAKNIDATIGGNGINAKFVGSGSFVDAIKADGTFTAKASSIPEIVKALDLDLAPAAALGDANINGKLSMSGENLTADITEFKTQSPYLSGTFTGTVRKAGDALTATGAFNAGADKVADLAEIAGFDIAATRAVGAVNATGDLIYSGEALKVNGLNVTAKDGVVTGSYSGYVTLAEKLALNGKFDAGLTSLADFRTATGMAVPYARSVGKMAASGNVTGRDGIFTLSDIAANFSDGQINGNFTGKASTQNGFTLDGRLDADIPSLRAIAAEGGTELPPSTDAGPIFERFTIAGDVTGSPSDITFKDAALSMDALKGQGEFNVDLSPAKPFVDGTLNMEGLDLRPYMASYAAQNPTGKIQPWGEEPINSAPLKAVDGDFRLTSPNIKTDRMTIGQSDINAKLRAGILIADMPNLSLYGGLGSMVGTVDASGAIPKVSLEAKLDNLQSESFLGAVAGFTNASGQAGTGVKFTGQGQSIAQIMKSLDGGGDFKLKDGQIAGVDIGQFMTGLGTAFSSRTLPAGIGTNYETKFKDIIGLFTIEDGVAKIGKFSLEGIGVLAEGQGEIDLGNQEIDFSLRPRLTGEQASDLAAFGIPIRFTGDFGGVKPSLDTDLLGRIIAEKAKGRAKDEIRDIINDNIGGAAGDILGGVLGGKKPPTTTPETEPEAPATEAPTADHVIKEDPLKDVLGGILGGNQPKQPEPSPATQPDSETTPTKAEPEPEKSQEDLREDAVEDTLKSLFGRKKKKEPEPTPEK